MMMLKDEVQTLRQVPLFSRVAPAKLKLLAFASDRVSYRPGETLFRQGDPGDAAYVILAGKADIFADSPTGEIKVAELDYNSIVGEIAILCDISRTATVKAAQPLSQVKAN
jgi:CRP-like cAMP-binding protein